VKPIQTASTSVVETALSCDLRAHHSIQATLDTIVNLRRRPGPGPGERLPHNFLKHADEQTVVGLAAVLEAIHHSGLSETDFTNWGIVAAPSFLGRATLVGALQRFEAEGAWGISPHFIPHRSQHAVSGTISQVLKVHGPNFGTGGAPGSGAEALLAGAVLLEGNRLPGVWVVMSDWEPELIPDETGRPAPADAICHATVLALVPTRPGWQGPRLRITLPGRGESPEFDASKSLKSIAGLGALLQIFSHEIIPLTVTWQFEGGGCVELRRGASIVNPPKWITLERRNARNRAEVTQGGAGTENQR